MKEQVAIGVDLGGTSIKYALVKGSGEILWEGSKPTEANVSHDRVIDNIVEAVEELIAKAKDLNQSPIVVGVGSPGLIDVDNGVILGGAPNLPNWEQVPLAEIISDRTGLPAFIDNDANLMGLGEYAYGGYINSNHLIFITLGTGIGGAIIIDRKLYRGAKNAGAELGAIPMTYKGEYAYWEEFASSKALVERYRVLKNVPADEPVDGKLVFEKFKQGEQEAVDAVNENIDIVGQGLAGYINIFNPDQIIVGGGISEVGAFYIEGLKKSAEKYAMKDCMNGVEIAGAKLGNKAGFLGATYYALTRLETENM